MRESFLFLFFSHIRNHWCVVGVSGGAVNSTRLQVVTLRREGSIGWGCGSLCVCVCVCVCVSKDQPGVATKLLSHFHMTICHQHAFKHPILTSTTWNNQPIRLCGLTSSCSGTQLLANRKRSVRNTSIHYVHKATYEWVTLASQHVPWLQTCPLLREIVFVNGAPASPWMLMESRRVGDHLQDGCF